MQKTALLFAFLTMSILITSCSWLSSEKECTKMIDRRTMAHLLTDIFLLEALVSSQNPEQRLSDSVEVFYAGIFQKYEISQAEFEKAYECYLLDQQNMAWVMDEVLSALSIARSRIDEKTGN